MVILDASAAIEIVGKSIEGRALQILMQDDHVVSCELMRAEAASTARKLMRTQQLTFKQASECMRAAIDLVDDFATIEELEEEAFLESIRLDHSVYDMFYFVLARRSGGSLFTLDRKLIKLCEEHGVDCIHEIDFQYTECEPAPNQRSS